MALSSSSTQEQKNAHYRAALMDYTQAVSAHDAEAVLKLYAEDVALEDLVGSGGLFKRISELRSFYTRVCKRDITVRIDGHISCSKSNVACAPVRVDVESSSIHAIGVMQFNEQGLITRYDAHWGPGDVEGPDPGTGSDYGLLTKYDDRWDRAEID